MPGPCRHRYAMVPPGGSAVRRLSSAAWRASATFADTRVRELNGRRRGITLTIIWHSRTGAAEAMAHAAAEGAGASARLLEAGEVGADDLLEAGGLLFVCPENLAAMSGMMKEMFDSTYYPVLGRIEGRPYATAIAAGSDGTNAQAQIDRIVKGWRLRRVAEPLIVNLSAQTPEAIFAPKSLSKADVTRCAELGQAFAQGLEMGIF